VDRGVVQVRGGGGAKLQPIKNIVSNCNNNKNNKIPQQQALKKDGKHLNEKASEESPCPKPSAKFIKDSLNSHNKYRARHGAKPLVLDNQLSKLAQDYAEQLANSCSFQHSGDALYGENLYWAWSSDPNFALQGHEAVDSWYDECLVSYNYSREPTDTQSGHFTQLVWTTSERLGVGLARSKTGRHIVVMKYDPPGNYVGEYTKHVRKPI